MPFKTLIENRESSVYEVSLENAHILLKLRMLRINTTNANAQYVAVVLVPLGTVQNSSSFEGKSVTSSSFFEYSH